MSLLCKIGLHIYCYKTYAAGEDEIGSYLVVRWECENCGKTKEP